MIQTQLSHPGLQGTNVLGQAPAAEAHTGVEELTANTVIETDGISQGGDITAHSLGDLSESIDEADLGGQERVGCDLHQFSGLKICRHPWCLTS